MQSRRQNIKKQRRELLSMAVSENGGRDVVCRLEIRSDAVHRPQAEIDGLQMLFFSIFNNQFMRDTVIEDQPRDVLHDKERYPLPSSPF